eukprot:CAMPEP_0176440156 /NCGR_PEP_ID=MMETSP0127-20121128/20394_1 /TAXON_ID=938130 /ORGANISM="Platyophrya macrostoma, Strain WH" /LENGTH=100 /DNA_ID=CAMNT_0017824609 /DNA_START=285 /DNA_END=588 /DNA_ORIENTATION=-
MNTAAALAALSVESRRTLGTGTSSKPPLAVTHIGGRTIGDEAGAFRKAPTQWGGHPSSSVKAPEHNTSGVSHVDTKVYVAELYPEMERSSPLANTSASYA